MKMITAIVSKDDAKYCSAELVRNDFSVTRLATSGGFLQASNMTLIIVTEDERVDDCIEVIRRCCSQHTEIVPNLDSMGMGLSTAMPMEVTVGGATVFTTNVEQFYKL